MFGSVVIRRGELTTHALSDHERGATVTDMSRAVPMLLLNALLDDFSPVRRPGGRGGARVTNAAAAQVEVSPAVGRRAVDAQRWDDRTAASPAGRQDIPVLIHGPVAKALAGYRSASAVWPAVGIDVAHESSLHCVESVHRALAHLTELPRTVPVTVGLALEPGWRDALSLIPARGRSVRFAVCGIDAPNAPALADAIRMAVAEQCSFSWGYGTWRPVTDPWTPHLPGILNVLLATAAAVHGEGSAQIGSLLARTDPVDVVDAICDLDEETARRIRALLDGFAVSKVGPVVDALSDLDLLPKERQYSQTL